MPATIADVAQERPKRCWRRRGVDWRYEVTATHSALGRCDGTLADCRCRRFPSRMPPIVPAALRASRLNIDEQAIRDGIAQAALPGRFQMRESPQAFDVAHNPHAAEYLDGRLKMLPKRGRVLAVIAALHDKAYRRHVSPRLVLLTTGIVLR